MAVTSAEDRAAEIRAAIEESLEVPDGKAALNKSLAELQAAAKDLRVRSPGYAALADAQLAGDIAGTAERLRSQNPRRHRLPSREHLKQVFADYYASALDGGRTR